MRWRSEVQEEEQRWQMAAAAARGFLEINPTAVIFRNGNGETEQGERMRVENVQRCTKQTWVRILLRAYFYLHGVPTRWLLLQFR